MLVWIGSQRGEAQVEVWCCACVRVCRLRKAQGGEWKFSCTQKYSHNTHTHIHTTSPIGSHKARKKYASCFSVFLMHLIALKVERPSSFLDEHGLFGICLFSSWKSPHSRTHIHIYTHHHHSKNAKGSHKTIYLVYARRASLNKIGPLFAAASNLHHLQTAPPQQHQDSFHKAKTNDRPLQPCPEQSTAYPQRRGCVWPARTSRRICEISPQLPR